MKLSDQRSGSSGLPLTAKLVITAAFTGGVITLGAAILHLVERSLSAVQVAVAVVLGVMVVASWLWPLMLYRGVHSEAVHLDEGFLVILMLLVPGGATVVVFALATVLAQLAKQRPFAKSAFNFGQVLISVGAAVAVYGLFPAGRSLGLLAVLAAGAGAVAFFAVNSFALAGILAATGTPWRRSILDGLEIRLMLVGGAVTVAVPMGLVVSAFPWALPLAVGPLVILRQVLAGHFEARHDRARMRGLFEATLDANRSMGRDYVTEALLNSARNLLRCPEAELGPEAITTEGLSAELPVPEGRLWLSVSGRSRTEPFDSADASLLEALAAVGAGALTNASLYQEGRFQRERLGAITSSLGEGVCAVSQAGDLTFINPAAAAMLGWDDPDAIGEFGFETAHDASVPAPTFVLAPALRAASSGETVTSYEARFERRDGTHFQVAYTASPIIDESGPSGAVLVFRDITERKQFEEQLARHAFHDTLTGLPNRRLFIDHLDHAIRSSERTSEQHAVLFADVDRFKLINDSLGHHAGDQLLVAMAERISASVRPGDMVARFGGDEFTVLLEGVSGTTEPLAVARRMLECLREPILLSDGHEVVTTVSIGIALTSADKTRDDILHDADVAMYQAKARGRTGQCEVFDVEAMGVRSADRIELEAALRGGIEREELEVYYQPLFTLSEPTMVGVEALVRWNHPERGLLSPDHFIGLAEETGLILPLGRFVLERACRQARQWLDSTGMALKVSVNLSARQFQHAALVEDIAAVLASTGVDPAQVCLEITESLAMDDVHRTAEILFRLKALGVEVAIDDFGTGYSSLGYLASFPVDVLKVDRSFVDGVDTDKVKSAIVSAVITLSEAINATTVVEGVETAAELAHLQALGCPLGQGFYYSRPVPACRISERLARESGGASPAVRRGAALSLA